MEAASSYTLTCQDDEDLGLENVFTLNNSPADCQAVVDVLNRAVAEFTKYDTVLRRERKDASLRSIEFLCFGDVYVARFPPFSTETYTRGCHWFPRLLA
jgi:hypothetical protein